MKRWLIRSFFLGLLLLCGAGWVASYTYSPCVSYSTRYHAMGVWLKSGSLIIEWFKSSDDTYIIWGFSFVDYHPVDGLKYRPHILGFYGDTNTYYSGADQYRMIGVPFWFLTLLFTGILFLVWRKTRPKPNPATAFPVEVKK